MEGSEHRCEDCGGSLRLSERLPGWWCPDCDGSEEYVLDGIREAEEERYDPVTGTHCRECETYGDVQCSLHGEAAIEALRVAHEDCEVREALHTILACPKSWSGPAWDALLTRAQEVLREMGGGDG